VFLLIGYKVHSLINSKKNESSQQENVDMRDVNYVSTQ